MRFLPFTRAGEAGLAVVEGDQAIDLGGGLPRELDDVIAGGEAVIAAIRRQLAEGGHTGVPVASLTPRFPIARFGKCICLGLNYAAHAKEGGHAAPPTYPAFFLRTRNSLIGADEPLVAPKVSDKFDYEAELMVIVGKGGRHIAKADALSHVFGYTLFNDGSVRDYQRKTAQWTAGKNFDATGPVGPVVVTADELPPGATGLKIESRINGRVLQSADTSDMIFDVATTIATISEFTRLDPGDMIAMGTPEGVGYPRNPPVFMRPGDTVEIEIGRIGVLSSRVVAEDAST